MNTALTHVAKGTRYLAVIAVVLGCVGITRASDPKKSSSASTSAPAKPAAAPAKPGAATPQAQPTIRARPEEITVRTRAAPIMARRRMAHITDRPQVVLLTVPWRTGRRPAILARKLPRRQVAGHIPRQAILMDAYHRRSRPPARSPAAHERAVQFLREARRSRRRMAIPSPRAPTVNRVMCMSPARTWIFTMD